MQKIQLCHQICFTYTIILFVSRYNDPLLRTSISLVASQDGKARSNQDGENTEEQAKKDLSIAVSSALLLALSVGVVQLMVYASLASGIIKGMG